MNKEKFDINGFDVNDADEYIQRLFFTYDMMKKDLKRTEPIRTLKNYTEMIRCVIAEFVGDKDYDKKE